LEPAEAERRAKDIVRRLRWKGPVFRISGATGAGTDDLKQAVMRYLEEHPRVPRSQAEATADAVAEAAAAAATGAPGGE
jgi:GTP-binding protein